MDSRPSHLVQFAKIGATYMENIVGVKNPRVGLVNIGAEEEKGNALTKEDHYEDARLIKELGANTIRLAHYQHSQDFMMLVTDWDLQSGLRFRLSVCSNTWKKMHMSIVAVN